MEHRVAKSKCKGHEEKLIQDAGFKRQRAEGKEQRLIKKLYALCSMLYANNR